MFFNAAQTQGAIGSVVPAGPGASKHLSPQQFPGKAGGDAAEGGAAEGAAGGAEAAGGAAELAELAPLIAL